LQWIARSGRTFLHYRIPARSLARRMTSRTFRRAHFACLD
jgi:hypothetical protein